MEWCKHVCRHWVSGILRDERDTAFEAVVMAAFEIAQTAEVWADCVVALDALRYAVGKFDSRWMD